MAAPNVIASISELNSNVLQFSRRTSHSAISASSLRELLDAKCAFDRGDTTCVDNQAVINALGDLRTQMSASGKRGELLRNAGIICNLKICSGIESMLKKHTSAYMVNYGVGSVVYGWKGGYSVEVTRTRAIFYHGKNTIYSSASKSSSKTLLKYIQKSLTSTL